MSELDGSKPGVKIVDAAGKPIRIKRDLADLRCNDDKSIKKCPLISYTDQERSPIKCKDCRFGVILGMNNGEDLITCELTLPSTLIPKLMDTMFRLSKQMEDTANLINTLVQFTYILNETKLKPFVDGAKNPNQPKETIASAWENKAGSEEGNI